ncbi:DUF488 family protein [Ruminococcaceae bacterium OttesenSCG-928-I18]|nr:DUF488 family protein [Ruminococcaceae bacterium OttesenSCG-928-I18]
MNLFTKSIHEKPSAKDGKRLLTELFWPRGVWKQQAELADWMRQVAPSRGLLQQFQKGEIDFQRYRSGYLLELELDEEKREAVESLLALTKKTVVTLVYSTGNPAENSTAVLYEYLIKLQEERDK